MSGKIKRSGKKVTLSSRKDRQLFGTDGIRGVANTYPMTADMALRVGQSTAAYFDQRHPEGRDGWRRSQGRPRVVIGKDTRISNYMLEQAIASGVCSMGVDAILTGPIPTPGLSFLVRSMRADGGIMISASHNSYEYSGIKIFSSDGEKLPDSEEMFLEALILGASPLPAAPVGKSIGKAFRIDDALGRYIVHTKAAFSSDLSLEGMRIAIDCANGAAYKVAPTILLELGAEVMSTGVSPTGSNINENKGALYPEVIAGMVHETRADIGISLDGDADRVILSDEKGEVVDGDEILAICGFAMKQSGLLAHRTVVGTVMCNLGLKLAMAGEGIQLKEVPVGDRYVLEEMRKGGFSLGGEPSGHILFSQHGSSGDGMLTALKVIEIMLRTQKPLSELKKIMTRYPQVLENVTVRDKKPLDQIPEVAQRIQQISEKMGDQGRLLVRYSGTEPLLRIMVEGERMEEIRSYALEIAHLVRKSGLGV